jgi:NAD(P)-dependent dehydrogenase (short-subunit alcohol dehydrogenase family)
MADDRVALTGSTALVTGGGQGVGEATARRLVRNGVTGMTLVGRTKASLERVAADLRKEGAKVLTVEADISQVEDCRRAVAEAEAAFGAIAILCICAGATDRGTILDTSPEIFDKLFNTNVRGAFFLMQSALPKMIEKKNGVIVSVSSMLAHGGVPHLTAYSASKGALNILTRNVANGMRHNGIRVHAINLGWTVTPAERRIQSEVHGLPPDWPEVEGAKQPFGRLLEADDPAALTVFLASKGAEMMTGTLIDLEQWVVGTLDAR